MRLQLQEIFATDADLSRMLELIGSPSPDVEIEVCQFEAEGVFVKGLAKTPLGKLGFETRWTARLEAPGLVCALTHLRVGQSFPIPFLKSMVLEQIRDLLKPWPGVDVVDDEIQIDYFRGLKSYGLDLDCALTSLEMAEGECRLGFTRP